MRALPPRLRDRNYDLCYVDCGDLVTAEIAQVLRGHAKRLINYSIDDPLGGRDGARSNVYRRNLSVYDMCVVMRAPNVQEAKQLGARKVLRVYMSADEVSHAPRALTEADRRSWDSEVLFLGTWFPERGPFLLGLIDRGVDLTIRGANWNKAPEWGRLRSHWKGGHVSGDEYAKAIQCAKVNIGLLSKGNRDEHTTRSLEIPALGGLLCAERTGEHAGMYREDTEALFWSSVDECAEKCRFALMDEQRRLAIARAGHERVRANGHYNEVVLRNILTQAMTE